MLTYRRPLQGAYGTPMGSHLTCKWHQNITTLVHMRDTLAVEIYLVKVQLWHPRECQIRKEEANLFLQNSSELLGYNVWD